MEVKSMFLGLLCLLMLTGGCAKETVQKDEDFRCYFAYETAIDAGDGFYFTNSSGFLHYFDYREQEESIVCNKANCKHEEWSETTPSEERCSAYIGGMTTGFVSGDKLYLMENEFGSRSFRQIRIVESDLDRTNQREVKILDVDSIYSFAVKDGILYAVMSQSEVIEQEDGSKVTGSRRKAVLFSMDLADGTMETLVEKEGIGSVISIMGAEKESLYLNYTCFEKEFDGTNFQEAGQQIEYYEYSLETGKLEEKLKGEKESQILHTSMIDGQLFASTTPSNRSDQGETMLMELKKINLDTGEEETLARTSGTISMLGEYAVYESEKGEGGCIYDFRQEEETIITGIEMENIFLYYPAGDYIYGAKYEGEGSGGTMGFFSLNELRKGREAFIPVEE